jgi:polyhydroxyalkanoate synthesis regulator phasin
MNKMKVIEQLKGLETHVSDSLGKIKFGVLMLSISGATQEELLRYIDIEFSTLKKDINTRISLIEDQYDIENKELGNALDTISDSIYTEEDKELLDDINISIEYLDKQKESITNLRNTLNIMIDDFMIVTKKEFTA